MIWFPSYDLYIIVLIGSRKCSFYHFTGKLKNRKQKVASTPEDSPAGVGKSLAWWKPLRENQEPGEELPRPWFCPIAWFQLTTAWQCCHTGNFCCQEISQY